MDKTYVYLEVARAEYQRLESARRDFMTRAIHIISFGGALLAVAVLYLGNATALESELIGVFAGMIVLYVICACLSAAVLWPHPWRPHPDRNSILEQIDDNASNDEVKIYTAELYDTSVKANRPRVRLDAELVRGALLCVLAEGLLLAIMLLLSHS